MANDDDLTGRLVVAISLAAVVGALALIGVGCWAIVETVTHFLH